MSRSCCALLVAGLAMLGACSSTPPTRFYTLSVTAPDATPPAPGAGLIRIDRVTIPGEIDRPEWVRRTGPNQLTVAGLDRWAAPLDEMIQRVLTDDIARRAPSAGQGPRHSILVDIHEFYGDGSCNVTLRAVWVPKQLLPDAAQPATEEIQVPSTGACPGTLPATMSSALGQLSDRIVAGVARARAASEH